MTSLFEQEMQDPDFRQQYARAKLEEEMCELIATTMQDMEVGVSQLSELTGISIKSVLSGDEPLTLIILADIMFFLDHKIELNIKPQG